MSRFAPEEGKDDLQGLDGKVVVMTGGANGIGAALVRLLHAAHASVVFGDANYKAGEALASELGSEHAVFIRMDVRNYADNVQLFKTALEKWGKVDHAVAVAGLIEQGNWFRPDLGLEDVEKPPDTTVLDINLLGVLYFSRIASVYLRQNCEAGEDRSLTLLSSIAGFMESPGLFTYQAAKHGVLGLMRSLRLYTPSALGLRVNAICPWMTATALVAGIQDAWYKAELPVNQPIDVAKVIMNVLRLKGLNGKAMYVEGGRAWEIEGGIERTMAGCGGEDGWLGLDQVKELERGQKVLADGAGWISKQ